MEQKKTRLFSRDYILLMVSVMGANFVNYFFFSTLPLYAKLLTGTATAAGYLSLAYSATALVTRPVAGLITDKVGRVKLIAIGAALATAACLLYGFTTSIVLLILIRILNGIGMGMNATSGGAAVPDIVPEEKLGQGVGYYGLNGTIAQALGPLIALAIIGNGESLGDFRKLFLVAAAFCCVSLISGCLIRYERNRKRLAAMAGTEAAAEPERLTEAPEAAEYGLMTGAGINSDARTAAEAFAGTESLAEPQTAAAEQPDAAGQAKPEGKIFFGFELQVLAPSLVMMIYFIGISSILTFLTLYGQQRGFQVENLGFFFMVSAGGVLLSRLIISRVIDKRGSDVVIIPAMIVVMLCLFTIPLVPSLPYLICVALPYGIATGIFNPALNTMMFRRCSPKRRGAVSAAYNLSVDVGITLGAPLLGLVADHMSFNWVFWLAAITVCAAFLFFVFFASDKRYAARLAKRAGTP